MKCEVERDRGRVRGLGGEGVQLGDDGLWAIAGTSLSGGRAGQIRMVAQEKILRRKLTEMKARIAETPDEASRIRLQGLSEVYGNALPEIEAAKKEGVAALERSQKTYERLKIKVEVIEAQIDLNKTLKNAQSTFDVEGTSREVNQLIEELENDRRAW